MKAHGVYEEDDMPSIGETSTANYEETITPFMNALSKFRDDVKEKAGEGPQVLFKLSDQLRDEVLPYLGIRLEDRAKGQPSYWKLADKNVLIQELLNKEQEKQKAEEAKRAKKELDLKKVSFKHND